MEAKDDLEWRLNLDVRKMGFRKLGFNLLYNKRIQLSL
jgi:hypothetical protein